MPILRSPHRLSVCLLLVATALAVTLSAQAESPADALLAQVAAAARNTRSLRAEVRLTRVTTGQPPLQATGSVLLMKPNYALLKLTGNDPAVPTALASDGVSLFALLDPATYTQTPIDARASQLDEPWWGLPYRYFFTQSVAVFLGVKDPALVVAQLPDQTIQGEPFHVISVKGTQPFPYVETLYINSQNLLQCTVVDFGATVFSAELTGIRLNETLSAKAFHYAPPLQAKRKQQDPLAALLAVGTVAPAFQLPSPAGRRISLVSQQKGSKATLVNFWFLDCPPCRIEFPEFEKLYTQLHAKGLNIVAVDRGDAARDVTAYVRKAGLTFPILLGGPDTASSVFARYKAQLLPTTYLLDADGKIVYRAVGGDLDGLRKALVQLGLQ